MSGRRLQGSGVEVEFGQAITTDLLDVPATVEDENAVGVLEELGILRRVEDDGRPLLPDLGNELIEVALGLDIDALCRIVQEKDARPRREGAAEDHLLLVAARQRA